jgi:hypothetical protein
MDMLNRMQSGRFKVFKHLNDWWEEFSLYHRKDGKVVKEGDDLMAATRYAIMSLRHASTTRAYHNFRRKLSPSTAPHGNLGAPTLIDVMTAASDSRRAGR